MLTATLPSHDSSLLTQANGIIPKTMLFVNAIGYLSVIFSKFGFEIKGKGERIKGKVGDGWIWG